MPVPTALYVSLLDQLSGASRDGAEPASVVSAILRKYLDDVRSDPPRQRRTRLALDWSDDRLMFGAPPAPTAVKAQVSAKKSEPGNDWCIGCGCPSEDLLSL
ncbi:MAG: hypothetical protein H6R17_2183 [Proteobacteria bacterium]|nr:hypothetical protein [Pseudomonadota bacterium]